MNTITNSTVRNISIALAGLTLLVLPFSFAHAAGDDWTPDFLYAPDAAGGNDFTFYPNTYTDYYPNDYTDFYPNSYDTQYYDDYYTPSYSSGSGFGGGSFFGGSGFMGSSGFTRPGNINSNTNINENTCTNGSCNQNINAPTNIVTNYPPQQTYPVYQPVYPSVYVPPAQPYYQQPVAYNYNRPAPYVTLSAVPYTGLDLGPWGTAMYWGFLVLWCLIAAYLIAVKKIQNKIAGWFVGSSQNPAAQKSSDLPSRAAVMSGSLAGQTFVRQDSAPKFAGGIDPFIQSQINRAK